MSEHGWSHRISAGILVAHEGRVLVVNHRRAGHYDFWVAPGGGVQATETLEQAAAREALEETGLQVEVGPLRYVEEFYQPGVRYCKFWFLGRWVGGQLSALAPEAQAEHIVDARWMTPEDLASASCFPPFLCDAEWRADTAWTDGRIHRLGLRAMEMW